MQPINVAGYSPGKPVSPVANNANENKTQPVTPTTPVTTAPENAPEKTVRTIASGEGKPETVRNKESASLENAKSDSDKARQAESRNEDNAKAAETRKETRVTLPPSERGESAPSSETEQVRQKLADDAYRASTDTPKPETRGNATDIPPAAQDDADDGVAETQSAPIKTSETGEIKIDTDFFPPVPITEIKPPVSPPGYLPSLEPAFNAESSETAEPIEVNRNDGPILPLTPDNASPEAPTDNQEPDSFALSNVIAGLDGPNYEDYNITN